MNVREKLPKGEMYPQILLQRESGQNINLTYRKIFIPIAGIVAHTMVIDIHGMKLITLYLSHFLNH